MSANRRQPHVLVLPEDDANRQIANGFVLELAFEVQRRIQVLPVAGGWRAVLDKFELEHAPGMRKYPERRMVLIIDFDNAPQRLEFAKSQISEELGNRVFIIGALSKPEDLKAELGSYETIGRALAKDCGGKANGAWRHPSLQHNDGELARLREEARPILFP